VLIAMTGSPSLDPARRLPAADCGVDVGVSNADTLETGVRVGGVREFLFTTAGKFEAVCAAFLGGLELGCRKVRHENPEPKTNTTALAPSAA